jgi:hypothetical protein
LPDLSFAVERAEVMPYAASPHLVFKLRIENADVQEKIHSIMLRCQIMIEATRRTYNAQEKGNLVDLFGLPDRWSQTLHSMLWANIPIVIPSFQKDITVDLQAPCSFDFNISSTKYYAALQQGEAPLSFLFSGTIFHDSPGKGLRVAQISWDTEARFQLPALLWKELMDLYYPNSNWLRLSRDVFELLNRYRMERGLPTHEDALEALLQKTGAMK